MGYQKMQKKSHSSFYIMFQANLLSNFDRIQKNFFSRSKNLSRSLDHMLNTTERNKIVDKIKRKYPFSLRSQIKKDRRWSPFNKNSI